MGTSICIVAGKEGSGKTTIAVNLAIAMSKLGMETIIVDGDLEGASVSLMLGVEANAPTLHEVLAGKKKLVDAIVEKHGIKAIVGSIKIEDLLGLEFDYFPGIIQNLESAFDIVIVDSPGGLGYDAVTVITSCKNVLLVLTPDLNSITNTLKIMIVAKKSNKNIIGAIVSRSGSEYDIPKERIEDILNVKVIGEIKEQEIIKRASQEATPAILLSQNSQFAKEMNEIAKKVLKAIL